MSTTKSLAVDGMSQWKDAKVIGGSKSELTKSMAQIRSQVRDERRIFSFMAPSLGFKNKSTK